MELSCVIDKRMQEGEASYMGGEVHLLFCLLSVAPGARDGGFMCVVFLCIFDCAVTSVIHTIALPCQQDKTK